MGRDIRSNESLGKIIKKVVDQSTGPKLTSKQAKELGIGREFTLSEPPYDQDATTQAAWAFQVMYPAGLGTYISPSGQAFIDQHIVSGDVYFNIGYIGDNGNIKFYNDNPNDIAFWGIWSANVFSREQRNINLKFRTNHSLWAGIGLPTGEKDTIVTSPDNAPNQHTSAWFSLTGGTMQQFQVAIYAPSGTLDFTMDGDLALQVDRFYTPDKIAPQTPTGVTIVTKLIETGNNVYQNTLSWVKDGTNLEADKQYYTIWRAKNLDGATPADADFERYSDVQVTASGELNGYTWFDYGVGYKEYAFYRLSASDLFRNESARSDISGLQVGDLVAPGYVTSLSCNGTSTISGSITLTHPPDQQAIFTWTDPTDTDLIGIKVWESPQPGKSIQWGSRTLIDYVPSGVEQWVWPMITGSKGDTTYRKTVYFTAIDKEGNEDLSINPPYTHLTMENQETIMSGGMYISISPDPNAFGWHNSDPTVRLEVLDGASIGFVTNWPPDDGLVFISQGATQNFTLDDETTASGHLFTAYAFVTDGTTPTNSILIKLDKTAPSVPSGLAITKEPGQLRLNWEEGSDTHSGLLETRIYRSTGNDSSISTLEGAVPAGTTGWIDSTLVTDTEYYYWLKHSDRADNLSSFSGAVSGVAYPMGSEFSLNWLDNASFERVDPAGNEDLESWEGSGSPYITGLSFHGVSGVVVGPNNRYIQRGIPLIGDYHHFSVYALDYGAGAANPRLMFSFRDLSGTEVQSFNLIASGTTTTAWQRFSDDSTGDQWVIGPSGSSAPNLYHTGAKTLDVSLSAEPGDPATVLDAVQMQQVLLSGDNGWPVFEDPNVMAPTQFYDSRVLNRDRINAYVGRFAEIYANNITAGKVQSVDQSTYFDLDNAEIRLTHTNPTGHIWSTFTPSAIEKTLDSGTTFYNYLTVREFNVEYGEDGSNMGTKTFSIPIVTGNSLSASIKNYFLMYAGVEYYNLSLGDRQKRRLSHSIEDEFNYTGAVSGWANIVTNTLGTLMTIEGSLTVIGLTAMTGFRLETLVGSYGFDENLAATGV